MASLTDLVSNLQDALTTGSDPVFPTTSCPYAFDPQVVAKTPPSDQFCVIQPNHVMVKEQAWASGPARNLVYSWYCTLWLFVRYNVDESGREDSYLLDTSLGSLVLADTIITTLQQFVTSEGWGYVLDEVQWPADNHDNVGWAVTKILLHTDLTGRSSTGT